MTTAPEPFRHQDPAVQPGAHFRMDTIYIGQLEAALGRAQHAFQDIDTALLGLAAPSRPGGALSTARQLIRGAVKDIGDVLKQGGGR
ncbi:MAG: hypothetical protein LLG93_10600 [Deltaproteobacteria bacterium]|nr:hypothetical protein [Deltaproteobacteria bacterium]